jgi:hypothetical protein
MSVPVYLAAGTHYYTSGDGTGTVNFLSIYVEALLSSSASSYSAGLFADYSHASESGADGTTNAGALMKYEANNWDSNAYLFTSKNAGKPSLWAYAGSARYQFAQNHKVGIEVVGTFRDPPASAFMIGYYAKVSPSLSFSFATGTALNSGRNRTARIVLVWQID